MKYLKLTIFISILFTCFTVLEEAQAASYYAVGVLKSENVLSGATITDINDFRVTAERPASTTVSISFSQDKSVFYSASGTKGAWTDCASGTTIIDLSGLSWTGALLFYKLKLETTDASSTPIVSEIRVNYNGTDVPAVSGINYEPWGVLLSDNLLAGATVQAISSFQATTSLPVGTAARISFSQDKAGFYSASGTKGTWTELADGGNTIDLSGLSWTGASLYYKIRLEALIDPAVQPKITGTRVVYEGSAAPILPASDYDWTGTLVSTDLLASTTDTMSGYEYFAYVISYLPYGASVKAQFSTDGVHWFSSNGTPWAYDNLYFGDNKSPAGAISLRDLNLTGAANFYYKIKFFQGADNKFTPILSSAGLTSYSAIWYGESNMAPPILDLSFDEGFGATAYDMSGNGNHGTLIPGAGGTNTTVSTMWDKGGKFGGAMDFDGDDYVDIGNPSSLELYSNLSISFCFNARGWGTGGIGRILSKRDGAYAPVDIHLDNGIVHVGGWDNLNQPYGVSSNMVLGKWYCGVFTYSDNLVKFYLDGKLVGSDTTTADLKSMSSYNWYIGRENANGRYFNGFIDEVKIYNYALSADEIKTLYSGGASLAMGGGGTSANNNGTTVTGEATKYCIPGDTAKCDAPVLELKLDEMTGTTAYDTSGNGNDGTLIGGPTWNPVGKVGSALEFDGVDDYVDAGAASVMDFGVSSFSVSHWIKISSAPTANLTATVNKLDHSYADGWYFSVNMDRRVSFWFRWDDTHHIEKITSPLNIGEWHNVSVAVNRNDNTVRLYVDGVVQGVASDISGWGDIDAEGTSFKIGMRRLDYPYFKGKIDDVKVYNYARTPAQIAWDYNRGKPVAHWRFDEGEGVTAHDESGNGHHGTLFNMDPATDWVAGKNNKALDFDGENDYVSIGDTSQNINTISFWTKQNSSSNYFIDLNGGTNTISLSGSQVQTTGFTTPTIYIDGLPNSTIPSNAWHQISVVTNTAIDVSNLSLGKVGTGYYAGQLDEIKLFNYPLTAAQIKTNYTGAAVGFGVAPVQSGSALVTPWICGTSQLTDIDGNSYNTVQIGDQCWMAENLMVSKNADGSAVNGTGDVDTTPPAAYADGNWEAKEGYIYNWQDAMNGSTVAAAQGICPDNWHVPSHDEWTDLERYICNAEGHTSCDTTFPKDTTTTGYLGMNEGMELKAVTNVNGVATDPNGDDGYGFEALLAGRRFTTGPWANRGSYAYFWSSSVSGGSAWRRYLGSSESRVGRSTYPQAYGFSVRCLKN